MTYIQNDDPSWVLYELLRENGIPTQLVSIATNNGTPYYTDISALTGPQQALANTCLNTYFPIRMPKVLTFNSELNAGILVNLNGGGSITLPADSESQQQYACILSGISADLANSTYLLTVLSISALLLKPLSGSNETTSLRIKTITSDYTFTSRTDAAYALGGYFRQIEAKFLTMRQLY